MPGTVSLDVATSIVEMGGALCGNLMAIFNILGKSDGPHLKDAISKGHSFFRLGTF